MLLSFRVKRPLSEFPAARRPIRCPGLKHPYSTHHERSVANSPKPDAPSKDIAKNMMQNCHAPPGRGSRRRDAKDLKAGAVRARQDRPLSENPRGFSEGKEHLPNSSFNSEPLENALATPHRRAASRNFEIRGASPTRMVVGPSTRSRFNKTSIPASRLPSVDIGIRKTRFSLLGQFAPQRPRGRLQHPSYDVYER